MRPSPSVKEGGTSRNKKNHNETGQSLGGRGSILSTDLPLARTEGANGIAVGPGIAYETQQSQTRPTFARRKCGYVRCKNKFSDTPHLSCGVEECGKTIHESCFCLLLDDVGSNSSENTDTGVPVCQRRCLNKLRKLREIQSQGVDDRKKRVLWSGDGSLEVLMQWLTTDGNYARYVGGASLGRTKESYHSELQRLIRATPGCTERSEKDIASKISSLEKSFRDASDWLANTGAGLDEPGKIRNYVIKKWPHYYDLLPVMGDRPIARPLFTNEDPNRSVQPICTMPAIMENDSSYAAETEEASAQSFELSVSSAKVRKKLSLTEAPVFSNKKRRSGRGASLSSNIGFDPLALLNLRREEITLKKKEVESKQKVDNATTTKFVAEAAFAEAQAARERQKSRFELMKQKKELRDMGYTDVEIDDALAETSN